MKKSFKFIMMALFISFAFALSACGGGQLSVSAKADIGKAKDYTIATTDDTNALQTYVDQDTAETDVNAYRLTLKMAMKEENKTVMSINYNGIIAAVENDLQMAVKMGINMQGIKGGAYMYYQNGVIAMQATGVMKYEMPEGKTKVKATLPVGEDVADIDQFAELLEFDLEDVLADVEGMDFTSENIVVKVNTQNELIRYEITTLDTTGAVPVETAKLYLIFKNNKLVQTQAQMEMDGMEIVATIEAFEGEIEMPNFDDFSEIEFDSFFDLAE